MMLFSVFDKKVGAFMPMFPARAKGEAIRMVSDAAADPQGQFIKHLEDYSLFQIGEFDDRSGKFVQGNEYPLQLVELLELRQMD